MDETSTPVSPPEPQIRDADAAIRVLVGLRELLREIDRRNREGREHK